MPAKIAGLYAEVDVENSKFNQKMGLVKKTTEATNSKFEKLKATLAGGLGGDAAFKKLQTSVSNSEKEVQKAKLALDTYKLSMQKATKVTDEMKAKEKLLSTSYQEARLNLTKNQQALSAYEAKIKSTQTSLFGLSAILKTAFAFAIIQGIRSSVSALSDFETGITNVYTLLNKGTLKEFKSDLSNASKEAISMGFSINDANKALFDTVSAIGDVTKSIDIYKQAQILAIGGVADLSVATDGLTSVINAYGKETTDATTVANAFFSAQRVGKTTVADLAANIGKVAPIAKQAGISFQELLAVAAQLTLGGLSTDEATTALRQSIAALIKPASDAAKVLRDYGVPVGASELRAKGLTYALIKLNEAAEKNPDVIAEMIPNIRALTGVSSLNADAIDNVNNTIEQMNEDVKNGTGLLEAFNMQMKTLTQSGKEAKNAFEELGNSFISLLSPALIKLNQLTASLAKAWTYLFTIMKNPSDKKAIESALNSYIDSMNNLLGRTKQLSNKVAAGTTTQVISTGGTGTYNAGGKTKKGKSQDTLLNEQANLLKAQSDLEIASNDYTNAEVLAKKIELQEKLIALYKSTSTKGKSDQIQAQTELLDLEKQYNEQVLNDKIAALQQESNIKKVYAEMDTTAELNNFDLTEQQKTNIKQQATLAQLQAEVELQQQILELKRRGVDDIEDLTIKERQDYEQQLLNKLNAEKAYQEQLLAIQQTTLDRNVEVADRVSNTITDGLKSAIDGTKDLNEAFKDMLATMLVDIAESGIQKAIASLLNYNSSSGGNTFTNLLGDALSLFSGLGFASGGTPPANRASLVGEEGAELFVPKTSGTIIPADQTSSILNGNGQGTQTIAPIMASFNINTLDSSSFQQYLQKEGKTTIQDIIVNGIKRDDRGLRRAINAV